MGLPNLLTTMRIFLIPLVVLTYYLGNWGHLLSALFFILASITDFVDGYLARNLKQETHFGAFLDPVADKLLVTTALIMIVGEVSHIGLTLPAIIVILRELAVSGLREWVAKGGDTIEIRVSYVAKIKTAIQMVAISLLLLYKPGWPKLLNLYFVGYGTCLLYVAALLTIWSMLKYLSLARNSFDK